MIEYRLTHGIQNWFLVWILIGTIQAPARGQEFQPLFNGENLQGWVLVNTPPDTWSVQDGMLVCSGKPTGEIRTERMYQNFVLEVEWRHMIPKGNAGIFVWADDITARGVPFHRSVEVQVLENDYGQSQSHTTHGDIFPIHGATMVPINGRGGSRAFPTENRSKPSPEWNHYRITCNDGSIELEVNGVLVTQGKDANPRKGYICIESEGGVVHYRNLKIRELPETPVESSMIASADRGYRSLYSGLDLRGWSGHEEGLRHWSADDWILRYDGASAPSTLHSNESFQEFGFVLDVRLIDQSSSLSISLGSETSTTIQLSHDAEQIGPLLEKVGTWNRIVGRIADGKFDLQINDKPFVEGKPLKADRPFPLQWKPEGKVELANLYVRDLD